MLLHCLLRREAAAIINSCRTHIIKPKYLLKILKRESANNTYKWFGFKISIACVAKSIRWKGCVWTPVIEIRWGIQIAISTRMSHFRAKRQRRKHIFLDNQIFQFISSPLYTWRLTWAIYLHWIPITWLWWTEPHQNDFVQPSKGHKYGDWRVYGANMCGRKKMIWKWRWIVNLSILSRKWMRSHRKWQFEKQNERTDALEYLPYAVVEFLA